MYLNTALDSLFVNTVEPKTPLPPPPNPYFKQYDFLQQTHFSKVIILIFEVILIQPPGEPQEQHLGEV